MAEESRTSPRTEGQATSSTEARLAEAVAREQQLMEELAAATQERVRLEEELAREGKSKAT
jgi:hypothetical protein